MDTVLATIYLVGIVASALNMHTTSVHNGDIKWSLLWLLMFFVLSYSFALVVVE